VIPTSMSCTRSKSDVFASSDAAGPLAFLAYSGQRSTARMPLVGGLVMGLVREEDAVALVPDLCGNARRSLLRS